MLIEQYNANPWPFNPKPEREESLHYTWAAFAADVDLVDTFTAHCAAAGVSTGDGVRQIVQRCLDTASGKLAWDRLATLLGPDARLERREGLPTMGDLRKAFGNEQVCQHVVAATAGSVENLASAVPECQASVELDVRLLEERSDAGVVPGDDSSRPWDIWQAWAWSVYLSRLATTNLRELKAARLDNTWRPVAPAPCRARL